MKSQQKPAEASKKRDRNRVIRILKVQQQRILHRKI